MPRRTKRKRTSIASGVSSGRKKRLSSGRLNSSDEGMSRCLNCARIDRRGDLKMRICKMDKEARRRKWILVDKKEWKENENSDGVVCLCLCLQCSEYAEGNYELKSALKNSELNSSWKVVWPAYFWSLLRSDKVYKKIGRNVWTLIPQKWRHWWMDSFNHIHRVSSCVEERVTMEDPVAVLRCVVCCVVTMMLFLCEL